MSRTSVAPCATGFVGEGNGGVVDAKQALGHELIEVQQVIDASGFLGSIIVLCEVIIVASTLCP